MIRATLAPRQDLASLPENEGGPGARQSVCSSRAPFQSHFLPTSAAAAVCGGGGGLTCY